MRVLVFGGTGAMGTPLVKMLSDRGDEVFVTSRKLRASMENIQYITGNAHDLHFVGKILSEQYFDVIVDFMVYTTNEFEQRANTLLAATGHYLFMSSSRVYADSATPITEDSPRLLDVCNDVEYLQTDEYALAKAREENVLFASEYKNWTIIRPYITYNTRRLQLATLEKDVWLKRVLEGHSIPLPQDVADCKTTMTYGDDVARAIAMLIGNEKAKGQAVHLTGKEAMTWRNVLAIYEEIIVQKTRRKPEVWMPENSDVIAGIMNNKYQICYDRMFDRVFDNSKMLELCGKDFFITPMEDGLRKCLSEFLDYPEWMPQSPVSLAKLDRIQKTKRSLSEISGNFAKLRYLGWRYYPSMVAFFEKIVHVLR